MPELGIIARFPLGVFQGRRADGNTRDPFPDPYRLHGALMQSAAKGVTAVERDGDLRPSPVSLAALRWLDEHPPDALELPRNVVAHRARTELVTYRTEGVFDSRNGKYVEKRRRPDLRNRVALAGRVGWLWADAPDDVARVLGELCDDVSCLGEADSPVVVETGVVSPTHVRVDGASQLSLPHGLRVGCAAPGTTDAQEARYESEHPKKRPTVTADAFAATKWPSPSAITPTRRFEMFEEPGLERPLVPWSRAMVYACDLPLPPETRISWCVAFHRLLAARLGDLAAPVITGNYAPDTPRPANRVAIQALDPSLAQHVGCTSSAFAILTPRDMSSQDLSQLMGALAGRLRLRSRFGESSLRLVADVAADEFWQPVAAGKTRFWSPIPDMVSETRRQPARNGERWTLAHAALLSLGFVFRDILQGAEGPRDYWSLVHAVEDRGGRAVSTHRTADSRVERYAYKYPEHGVVQPFRAILDIGTLAQDRTILAIGQARHVGGGLLVPLDIGNALAEELA